MGFVLPYSLLTYLGDGTQGPLRSFFHGPPTPSRPLHSEYFRPNTHTWKIGSLFAYRWFVMQFTHSTHIIQRPIQAVLSAHSQCGQNCNKLDGWRRVEKVPHNDRPTDRFHSHFNRTGKKECSAAIIIIIIHHSIHPSCDYSCITPKNQSMGRK